MELSEALKEASEYLFPYSNRWFLPDFGSGISLSPMGGLCETPGVVVDVENTHLFISKSSVSDRYVAYTPSGYGVSDHSLEGYGFLAMFVQSCSAVTPKDHPVSFSLVDKAYSALQKG